MAVRTDAPRRSITPAPASPPAAPSGRAPTNLSLPRDLVAEVDALCGRRGRSAFVEEAIRHAVRRERLRVAIEKTAGVLSASDYPHWRTSEDVVAWVEELRNEVTDPGP